MPREGVTTLTPLPKGYYVLRDDRTGMVYQGVDGTLDSTFEPPPGFLPPKQTLDVAPVCPKAARDAGVQGTVWVMAHFLVDGTIREAHVSRSVPGLDSAAIVTIRRMRFRPALINGKPADVWVELPVKFTLH
jgi:TonB family protein